MANSNGNGTKNLITKICGAIIITAILSVLGSTWFSHEERIRTLELRNAEQKILLDRMAEDINDVEEIVIKLYEMELER